jgi:transcriptional regulator with GAF, ATPase, and Fis domain
VRDERPRREAKLEDVLHGWSNPGSEAKFAQVTTSSGGELAGVFADVARQLQAEGSPGKVQERVSRAAVETVGGCGHAGISLVHRRGAIDTVAATDEVPMRVDAIQYEVGQGPCLNAISEHEVFRVDDLADDERWPLFSHRAAEETGVRSMLSFRLFIQDDTLGALNLYSREVQAFDEHAREVGTVLAAHAAIALGAAREHDRAEQLGRAVGSNREIGMAMGVLMTRRGLTQKDAFAVLLRASQYLNRKLRDVAVEVVETGEVPGRPAPHASAMCGRPVRRA